MSKEIHRYLNRVADSKVQETIVYWDGLESKFAIKFKDGVVKVLHFNDLTTFINISQFSHQMSISNIDEIVADSGGILIKTHDGFCALNRATFVTLVAEQDTCREETVGAASSIPTEDPDAILSMEVSTLEWHLFSSNFKLIVNTAAKLLDTHPEPARIFSLGQSPAWIIKAAKMLDKGAHKFGYIPFSSKYYELSDEDTDGFAYMTEHIEYKVKSFTSGETAAVLKAKYFSTLERLKLTPENILESYRDYNEKTIIVEFSLTGSGLATFLSILFGHARDKGLFDQVKEAVEILMLDDTPEQFASKQTITVEGMTINCKHQLVGNLPDCEFMWTLANGVDNGRLSDRLVPHYPPSMWDAEPVAVTGNEAHISELEAKLAGAVSEYIGCSEG